MTRPLVSYDNNVVGTLRLLEAMGECGVKTLVFSSSATVYGDPAAAAAHVRTHPLSAANPYGRTKLMHRGDACATPGTAAMRRWRHRACCAISTRLGAHAERT